MQDNLTHLSAQDCGADPHVLVPTIYQEQQHITHLNIEDSRVGLPAPPSVAGHQLHAAHPSVVGNLQTPLSASCKELPDRCRGIRSFLGPNAGTEFKPLELCDHRYKN